MSPEEITRVFARARMVGILRTGSREAAAAAMDAALRGGFRVVEFTLTTPGALDLIEEFAARPDVVVGAGTVLTVEQARQAADRGARFLVSPVVDEAVIEEARRLGRAVVPGCYTPTEMLRAHRAGAPMQKLFPGPADLPWHIRACLGPLPFLRLVPTSGVDSGNAAACLAAGAHAVGVSTALFPPEALEAGRWDQVEAGARVLLDSVAS